MFWNYRYLLLILFSAFGYNLTNVLAESIQLNSPKGKVAVEITYGKTTDGYAGVKYSVYRIENKKRITVLELSDLGLERADATFHDNLKCVNTSKTIRIKDQYLTKVGRVLRYKNSANEKTIQFQNKNGKLMQIVLRAYDDGVAYRYVFSETNTASTSILKEYSAFKLPENSKVWMQKFDKATQYSPAYEMYYANGIAAGTSSDYTEGWALPLLAQTNNSWLLIAESDLTPSYCGVHLNPDAQDNTYTIRFPESAEANGIGSSEPIITFPWKSPWRVITVVAKPEELLSTHLVNDLASPALPIDFSWVKPGRASWSWLSDNPSPKNFETLKAFVDFSAKMSWEYSLVDANWDLMEGGNIEQLVQYAQSKNVGILMWYNSGGPNNEISERPRDIIYNAAARKAEFEKLEKWGVKGIKVDFWGSDKQFLIKLYYDVLTDAAHHHLMVNLHGCTIPRGWSRTFPNLVTYESVKGEENYLFDETYPVNAPVQNTILPFTRNVIGPMDYTPTVFSDFKNQHITSHAHELALSIIFNSGITHFADHYKMYDAQPDYIKDFLSNVPVAFDQFECLQGYPGKSIIVAARKGGVWYVAGINSSNDNVQSKVSFNFLGSKKYKVEFIGDETNRTFSYEKFSVTKKCNKEISQVANGGFVMKISVCAD